MYQVYKTVLGRTWLQVTVVRCVENLQSIRNVGYESSAVGDAHVKCQQVVGDYNHTIRQVGAC